jgi:hypothetical protein
VGFGFEKYDGIGRHRTTENGLPVDASGLIAANGSGQSDQSFDGLAALQQRLAADANVTRCMTRYWAYYAYGVASWPQDACTIDAITADATAKGNTLESVLLAIVHAPHFTARVGDQ